MDTFDHILEQQKVLLGIKKQLDDKPDYWKDLQLDFNRVLDKIFLDLMLFEKNNASDEVRIYEMKRMFIQQCRDLIRLGKYNRHVIDKPYGYHGDFMIIEDIYKNAPDTTGIERCMDNYFLKTAASVATRNRKEDFKELLKAFSRKRANEKGLRILDLASGPCTDIIEFFETGSGLNLSIDCLDHDIHAIEYSRSKIQNKNFASRIRFLQRNAVKLALTKNIGLYLSEKYDLIFSTGLFDYLDEKISTLLVRNLKTLLKPNGSLIISNYRDKWSNPSRHFMEWGGDWELVYRTESDFLRVFTDAGFCSTNLQLQYEPLKVIQYCIARSA